MDDGDTTIWPDVPRICFGPGEPGHLDACLGWVLASGEEGTRAYVHGYRRAAEALFEHVASCQRMSPDYVLFPLAFLWRHHVELALKEIISTGRRIDGGNAGARPVHLLVELWQAAKPHIAKYGSGDAIELRNVEANIEEFERVDPRATGFRYPLKTDGRPGLDGAPSQVNLARLQEAMIAISNLLDAVNMCQSRELEAMAESCG